MSRRVLITGGASGLGLALAQAFVSRGDRVLVGDLAQTRPASLPDGIDYLPLDVRSQQAWDGALAHVREDWGGLDVLVNNAGVATGGRIDVESISDWERVLDINLLGVVRGCQTFTPLLKEQRSGHIVNTASLAGLVHGPGMSSYNAAKAGVVALSETLGFELAPWDIHVSAICPAFFKTNLCDAGIGNQATMAMARKLMERSPDTVDSVADRVLADARANRFLILPTRREPMRWRLKRWFPAFYVRMLQKRTRALSKA